MLNKIDLVGKKTMKKTKKELGKIAPCVFVSASKKHGIRRLREAIGKAAGEKNAKVALVGIPNSGKSSLLNALKGKTAAKVAPIAGYTKGEQWVRISKKILLLDSPGVLPMEKADELTAAITGAKNAEQMEDVEGTALLLLKFLKKEHPEMLEKKGLKGKGEEMLEQIAVEKGKLLKKGKPNTVEAAKLVLREWQRGNF